MVEMRVGVPPVPPFREEVCATKMTKMSGMRNMEQCSYCKSPHDFETTAFGSCMTCGKKDMCIKCCNTHECVPGRKPYVQVIYNPGWRVNLKSSKECNDSGQSD